MEESEIMRRAIELARRGAGWTSPNPLVGAVIVKDGRVIGEGWHAQAGGLHAERHALQNCVEDPAGATLYVTLEPCCHTGRTPPCTQAIMEAKLACVVYGSMDPNPMVRGKGAQQLREAGIAVKAGVQREACDALNPIFFHYITQKTPFVSLKYAMTADGKIASRTGASKWITGSEARAYAHRLRHLHRGILVGIGTVLADDPLLNCRMEGGRNPVRVVCDSQLRIPLSSRLCKTAHEIPLIVAAAADHAEKRAALEACGAQVWILPEQGGKVSLPALMRRLGAQNIDSLLAAADHAEKRAALEACGAQVWILPEQGGKVSLPALMRRLGAQNIDSLLAEGGGILHESLLRAGFCQRVYAMIAPKLFGGKDAKTPVEGEGIASPDEAYLLRLTGVQQLGEDLLLTYDKGDRNVYRNH